MPSRGGSPRCSSARLDSYRRQAWQRLAGERRQVPLQRAVREQFATAIGMPDGRPVAEAIAHSAHGVNELACGTELVAQAAHVRIDRSRPATRRELPDVVQENDTALHTIAPIHDRDEEA